MAIELLPDLTQRVIGAAIKVHRVLGPGLLEGTYRACLMHQLRKDGVQVRHEVPLQVRYEDATLDIGYRADLIVDGQLLLELKAVEALLPVHKAQVLTYLKHSRLKVALLINFNAPRLIDGLKRFVG